MSQLESTKQKPKFSAAITTKGYQKLINNTLGDPERAKRFIASITSAVAVNPTLQDCDAGTILAGALLGESLNLTPSPQLGQYYLVPFDCRVKGPDGKTVWLLDENGKHLLDKNKKWLALTEKRAQFVLGYKGYIQLAIRSGQYKKLNVLEIKDGELIRFDALNEEIECKIIEDTDLREQLPTIGYYAMFEYINGFRKAVYWTKDRVLAHADKFSNAFSAEAYKKLQNGEIPESDMWKYSSFWYKNFDDMAKKTLLRHLISRWGVMSTDLQTAFTKDAALPFFNTNNEIVTDESPLLEPEAQPDTMLQPEPEGEGHVQEEKPDPAEEKVNLSEL